MLDPKLSSLTPESACLPQSAARKAMPPLKSVLRGLRPEQATSKLELEALPSMDNPGYYDPPSPSSSTSSAPDTMPSTATLTTNSGNKRDPAARWMRRGKICAWGPDYEETQKALRGRKRLALCLEQFLPEAAADVNATPPENIVKALEKKTSRKRRREETADLILPHLRSPSPPASSADMAGLLALPQMYLDIMTSPSMRHTLGSDVTETSLQKTAAEMLEGEKGLMQALGRLSDVLRVRSRDVMDANVMPDDTADDDTPQANGDKQEQPKEGDAAGTQDPVPKDNTNNANLIPPLPHISDTDNLWRVTQELLQAHPPPVITFSVTPPGAAHPSVYAPGEIARTPVHRLFTHPNGLVISSAPNASFFAAAPQNAPATMKYNLDLPNQCRAVDDALERIAELLADCNEFKERLEEARMRVADVARVRKRVWTVVKQRAERELDRAEGKL